MRFIGRALLASAFVLGGCGGGEQAATSDTAAATTPAATTPSATPAAGETSGAPITGTTHRVEMVLNAQGEYRFVPSEITVKAGDGISFINVSGGPHNVAFDPAKVADDVEPTLEANMPGQKIGPLTGPLLTEPNAAYTISFANVKAGTYEIHCTPHLSFGMVGNVTVQ